jgi:large subunit ribosomal protein L6
MSRIGKLPISVPGGVSVEIAGSTVRVKGPKGELSCAFPGEMSFSLEAGTLNVIRASDEQQHRALHGMTRAVVNNMVTGVSEGFVKILEVEGVGYRSEMSGKNLMLYVGYSHPVEIAPPEGIEFEAESRGREIRVKGIDKQLVGQVCANIRKIRPPEPYKGKGIRYQGEIIRRKAGKSGKN